MLVKTDLAFLQKRMHGIVGPEKEKQVISGKTGRSMVIQIPSQIMEIVKVNG